MERSIGDEQTLGRSASGDYTLADGQVLGQYRILKRLGKGGMGEVYLAENTLMRKQVALKLLPKSATGGSFVDRFRIEARVMADLHHPNIVQVHHAGEEEGQYYLTMDYVCSPSGEPQTMEEVLEEKGRLPEDEVKQFALQICDALSMAHGKELVHRDLKPANMLIGSDGQLKITDFGLAKVVGDDYLRTMIDRSINLSMVGELSIGDEQTVADGDDSGSKRSSARAILGTYDYMAPEQKAGGDITPQTDLYAVGIILYRLLTGEKPEGMFEMPSELGCSAAWDSIVRTCMQKKPERRPASVSELRSQLSGIRCQGLGVKEQVDRQTSAVAEAMADTREKSAKKENPVNPARPAEGLGVIPPRHGEAVREDRSKNEPKTHPAKGGKKKGKGCLIAGLLIGLTFLGLIGVPSVMNARQKASEKAKKRNIANVERAKGMLTLPSSVYEKGIGATDGQVVSVSQVLSCLQGVNSIADLDVGDERIVIGKIGTTARYASIGEADRQNPASSTSYTSSSKSKTTRSTSRKSGGPQVRKVWAAQLGSGVEMEFMPIAAGSFQMGSNNGDSDEKPVHTVRLTKPFWMAKTEVTQTQYEKVMGSNPSHFKGAQNPVEKVSWNDAMEFCRKLTERERKAGCLPEGFEYTLPTEAQWEYACRAGTTGDYAGNLDSMAWYRSNSRSKTHPVGTKQPNAWGLHDMHGNVWEWCSDWYGGYASGSVTDPRGASSGSLRVFRGGGWYRDASYCRSANRGCISPGSASYYLGFRPLVQQR